MLDNSDDPVTRQRCAVELLLIYLQVGGALLWPGSDGLTLDEILRAYPQAAAAGLVPDWEELLARHPELAEELERLVPPRPRG
jgi:hypothetical protein